DGTLCIDCVAAKRAEESLILCRLCNTRKERGEFRRKMNWEHPECAACLQKKQDKDYKEFLADKAVAARLKQLDLQNEAVKELMVRFQAMQTEFEGLQDREGPCMLYEQRCEWARLLMLRVHWLERDQKLSDHWRGETASRHHASQKGAAEKFKSWEDLG
ncbi:unnamed protein product, partial [Symbiodinium pilosum]